MIGQKIGPYEVLAKLGEGGMGEVYRARDAKLQRDVAIKVLPKSLAAHPRRLLRFEREARALAALNHSNIATVYGIEDFSIGDRQGRGIVMELIPGEDLVARLRRGAIPLAEVLPIARQVAEALAAAHEAGIVHRDLKPANIKVRDDGVVKVLDFGLAKGGAADSDSESGSGSGSRSGSASGSGPQDFPTLTMGAGNTTEGAVLGTAAYMAPEQAKGKAIDKRADIWAFGVVLFEMLAGRRPFGGEDAADSMAHALTTEPEWRALPSETPPPIRRLLARCLTRDRRQRLHDIADARLEIDEAIAPRLPGQAQGAFDSLTPQQRWTRRLTLATVCVSIGLAIGAVVWKTATPSPIVTYARVDISPATELTAAGMDPYVVLPVGGARTALAWSPNGRTLAYIGSQNGRRQIYLRDLASDAARPLSGTDGARALTFSPDGEDLAFWADGVLRRIKIAGGPPAKICDAQIVNGLTWGTTRIIWGGGAFLGGVSPAGGPVTYVRAPLDPDHANLVRPALPFLLPGETAVLYTEYERQWTSGDERVMVRALTAGAQPRVLIPQAADARYLATGHIAFLRQGTLFVVPFDARSLEIRGEPVAVLKDVAQTVVAWDSDDLTLAGQFAISPQGMLAYVTNPSTSHPNRELIAVDRKGQISSLGAPLREYRSHVDVSPDGGRIGVSIQTGSDIRVFSYDLARHTLSRVAESLKGEVVLVAWSSNDRIAVQVINGAMPSVSIVRPDAASSSITVPDKLWAGSLSRDGNLLGMGEGDLWLYTPGQAHLTRIAIPGANEVQPVWSPDGNWFAYTSDATGRSEVYVRPFPGPGDAVMISASGGSGPAWNRNGRELFYLEPGVDRDRMMAVSFTSPNRPGIATALFSYARNEMFLGTLIVTPYAVSADGQRFYAVRHPPGTAAPVTEVNVILNWFEELRSKVK